VGQRHPHQHQSTGGINFDFTFHTFKISTNKTWTLALLSKVQRARKKRSGRAQSPVKSLRMGQL